MVKFKLDFIIMCLSLSAKTIVKLIDEFNNEQKINLIYFGG